MLIKELNDQPSFLVQKINELENPKKKGVYIPPYKLRQYKKELKIKEDEETVQKLSWELLNKSIRGIINKLNKSNIEHIIIELFNENLERGKGLLVNSIIKCQLASPNYTKVYASLISVLNSKLPYIGDLLIKRVLLQFRRSYRQNDQINCQSTIIFLANLINQKILNEFFGLQLLIFLLEEPTDDSVDVACEFLKEVGEEMTELSPEGIEAVFERLREILQEGEINKKTQFIIENIFKVRKHNFQNFKGLDPDLDLVEEEDQVTHNIDLDEDNLKGDIKFNIFKFDKNFKENEKKWQEIKTSILGEENLLTLKEPQKYIDVEEDSDAESDTNNSKNNKIVLQNMTETKLNQLREGVYMRIMNSVDYQEAVHKLLSMNLNNQDLEEMCNMVVDSCLQQKTYLNFYGNLSQLLCENNECFKKIFFKIFVDRYSIIFEYEVGKIRKLSFLFAHLLGRDGIDWHVFSCVELNEESTTSSSRIFLKILFQNLAENMGLSKLYERLNDNDMYECFEGIFPKDNIDNIRFAINFFTFCGLKGLTYDLRETLEKIEDEIEIVQKEEIEDNVLEIENNVLEDKKEFLSEKEEEEKKKKIKKKKDRKHKKNKKHKKDRKNKKERKHKKEKKRRYSSSSSLSSD